MIGAGQSQTLIGMGEVHGFKLYVIYATADGRIVKYGQARDMLEDGGASMAAQADVGQAALAVSTFPSPATAYVPGGVLTARPACPVAISIAGRVVTLSGVPSGAAWSIREAGLSGLADASGTMAITFSMAGKFTLAVAAFPAQDFSQQVTLA